MTIMIIQVVKDEGLPVVVWPLAMPLRYRKKISASETICELRFCVLSRKRILLLYSLKSVLPGILTCVKAVECLSREIVLALISP